MNVKRLLVVIGLVLVGVGLSAQNAAFAQETRVDSGKAQIIALVETVYNDGQIDALADFYAADYIENQSSLLMMGGTTEALAATIGMIKAGFSDAWWSVVQIGAQDDLVAARIVLTGTHDGAFFDVPASGVTVVENSIHFYRFAEGVISEHWAVEDTFNLLNQMGAMGAPQGREFTETALTTAPASENVTDIAALRVVEGLFDNALNLQDSSVIPEYVAADALWYTNQTPAPGVEGFAQFYDNIFGSFPDVNREVLLTVTDGSLVFVLSQITGTHLGDLLGIPASGNTIDYTSADIFHIVDERITEQWDVADYLTLFSQIGAM